MVLAFVNSAEFKRQRMQVASSSPLAELDRSASGSLISARLRRVMVKRQAAMGDVIMTTPILARLRHCLGPTACIDVMTNYPEVFRGNPHVNQIARFFDPKDYDAAWDLDGTYESRKELHAVDAYMQVVFGDDRWPSKEMFLDRAIPSCFGELDWSKVIALHPGVSDRNRTFSEAFWRDAIRSLCNAGLSPVLLGHSNAVVDLNLEASGNRVVNLVDQLSLQETTTVIANSRCFITGDTGLLHVAGTTDCPIVAVFTAIRPERRLPWRHGVLGWRVNALTPRLDCVGCHLGTGCNRGDFACVEGTQSVSASEVVEAALTLMSERSSKFRSDRTQFNENTGKSSVAEGRRIGESAEIGASAQGYTSPFLRHQTSAGRKIVFLGDCQAHALAVIYRESIAPHRNDTVMFVVADGPKTDVAIRDISEADIVVSEIFNITKPITAESMRADAHKIEFPAIFIGFLWPFAAREQHVNNQPTPHLEPGPYPGQLGDVFLNKLIREGVDPDEALRRYLDYDIVHAAHVDRLFELHIMDQQRRDKKTDFGFAEIIRSSFRDTRLFLTPHHPTLHLLEPLAQGVFERLGISPALTASTVRAQRVPPFPAHELPIHPAIIRHFGIRFVNESSRYAYNDEGYFTFSEYVRRYVTYSWNRDLYEGVALTHGRDLTTAYATLGRALKESPASALGWRSMSIVLRRTSRWEAATAAAEKAIALEPSDPAGYLELARVLLAQRDLTTAEEAARRAINIVPADGRSHHLLSEILFRQGSYEDALTEAQRAVDLRPGDCILYALLGRLLAEHGKWTRAEAAFSVAAKVDPSLAGFRLSFAQTLFNLGNDEEALAVAQELLPDKNPHAYALVGHIMAKRNELRAAEDAFQSAVEFDPAFQPFRDVLANIQARIKRA